jgi:hypothetical protein
MDSNRAANNDDIVTDVRSPGQKLTTIDSGYNQRGTQSGERPPQPASRHTMIRQRGTVLAGDIDAQSRARDGRCHTQRTAAFWEVVIDQNALEIGNDSQSTHYGSTGEHYSEWVFNLTLLNKPILKWTIVMDHHDTGSNHKVTACDVELMCRCRWIRRG